MIGTLSKSRRVVSIAIALILVLGIAMVCGVGASADSAPNTGSAQVDNIDRAQDNIKIEKIPVSDAMALRIMKRAFGPKIAARAKHRITKSVEISYEASPTSKIAKSVEANHKATISPEYTCSNNWCGYWLKNDDLKNIRADFNASHCTGSEDHIVDLTWVGIGGRKSEIIVQTGLEQRRMQLFYEVYPDSMYVIGDEGDVNEGDEIHSTVQNSYGDHYYLCSLDATTGDYFTMGYSVSPNPAGEGEWIVETPKDGGYYCHMGDFEDVTFTDALWWGNDFQTHPINYAGEELLGIWMENYYGEQMFHTVLQNGGTSFTVFPW